VIGLGKERSFGEELTAARGMQDHQMVVDGATDQAKAPGFDLVDCPRPVALPEE